MSSRDHRVRGVHAVPGNSGASPRRSGDLVSIDDADLVARAIDGDLWAKEALFRRHVRAVMGTVMRLFGGDRAEAEDIVQDTFATALAELGRIRDPRAIRGWLLSIAVRRGYRRLKRRRWLALFGLAIGRGEPALATMAQAGASGEVRAELALLDRALAQVPIELRIPWMLRHVEGEALEDIAEITSCSLATVKRRIKAAELELRRHIGDQEVDP